jgi:hypothetical protein
MSALEEKLKSLDFMDWLGIIAIIMKSGGMDKAEISPETINLVDFKRQFLKIHAIGNGGFQFYFIRADEITDGDLYLQPANHTLN